MDKRLLDPRRARRAPTAEDRAEQLAPYAEELPVAAGGYATFNGEVAGLRGVPHAGRQGCPGQCWGGCATFIRPIVRLRGMRRAPSPCVPCGRWR